MWYLLGTIMTIVICLVKTKFINDCKQLKYLFYYDRLDWNRFFVPNEISIDCDVENQYVMGITMK